MINDRRLHTFLILSVILLLCLPVALAETTGGEDLHCLNKENGLSGGTVSRIMIDHTGQVWIATRDGVDRYNGRQIVNFRVPRRGVTGNFTFDIVEGEPGQLFIATREGIFKLGHGERDFHRVYPSIKQGECLLYADGRLYVGNKEGLWVVEGQRVRHVSLGPATLGLENSVRDIIRDTKGNIWFLGRYTLNRYDPATGRVASHRLTDRLPAHTAFAHLASVRGKFYIGTKNNGLYVTDGRALRLRPVSGVGNVITQLRVSPKGDLCVSCDGSGAFLIDTQTDRIKAHFHSTGKGRCRIPTNAVYCYYQDRNGVDWFGFYRYGLAYYYHVTPLFRTYRFGDFTTDGLEVKGFSIRGSEKLISTPQGLYFIDESRRLVHLFTPETLGGGSIFTQMIYYHGLYYVGSYDGGLRTIDPRTLTVRAIPNEPLLATTTVAALTVGPDDRLWVGTGEGIFILDQHGSIAHYTENNARLNGGSVSSITFMPNGNAWVGGALGLTMWLAQNRLFENKNFPDGFFNQYAVQNIVLGHRGLTFFNTRSGIFYSDASLQRFGKIELPARLVEEYCYFFLDDGMGHFWLTTENGLFRVSYDMQQLQHFGYGEGLQCQVVTGSLKLGSDRRLWLGTSNGLMSVSPAAIDRWIRSVRYSVLLYDIRIGGDLIPPTEEGKVNKQRRIRLFWNILSSPLSVKPVLTDYARPHGRLYEYKLDGAGKWMFVGDGKEISVRNLLLGKHTLNIRLAGMPGTEAEYEISVVPNWLAVMELLLLLVAVGLFIWWRRYRNTTNILLAERDDIEDALMEMEKEQQQIALDDETVKTADTPKYERVKLHEAECADIVARMTAYVEQEKVYTNPDLKMSELADHLHVSASKLSQVFSLYLKENYYDYINRYRLSEFKRLITEGENRRYTLLALSVQCGFKKSSFFSTFRKVEHMTPTEYMKKNNIRF